jgi:hypothetical protein
MSAAGRIVLYMLSIIIAASMLPSQTALDVAGPRKQAQHDGDLSNPPSGKSLPILEPTVITVVEHPVGRSVSFGQPRVPSSSEAITRELQRELKRVGCYAGHLNGGWTRSTREAMIAFADRVNAKLPTDKPDSILLALVQGHSEKVCGVPCPSGQSLSHAQQCTPNALLARSGRTKLTAASGQGAWTVKTVVAGEAAAQEGVHPGDIAPAKPAGSAMQARAPRRAVRRHWQPTSRHEGGWASNFFKQRNWFSLN